MRALIVVVGCWLLLSASHGSQTIADQTEEKTCAITMTCPSDSP